MPINVQWDNEEKTIAVFEYVGKWTWKDLFSTMDECNDMLDTVDHAVGLIFDMRNSDGIPSGAFTQARQADRKRHKRVQFEVTVGAGTFVEILANTYQKIYGVFGGEITTVYASSMDEARKLIADKLNGVS